MKKLTSGSAGSFIMIVAIGLTITGCNSKEKQNNAGSGIEIRVNKKRFNPGDTATFTVFMNSVKHPERTELYLITPTSGTEKLSAEIVPGNGIRLYGRIFLKNDSPDGFYIITAIYREGDNLKAGKGSFICGKVVQDYAIMSNFDDTGTVADMEKYLNGLINSGGNAITLHANMTTEKIWGGTTRMRAVWASGVCKHAVAESEDRIEMMLDLTDKLGIPSFLSVSWDFTDSTLHNTGYMKNIQDITNELWIMFGQHPSLAGFYSYQEGSGTYFAAFMREFCRIVKQNNRGLLTMCAPNIDDPLLAGYLAAIDDLDIINYQAPIMTSYRPDNRKLFPNRRVKDVTSLSAGATRVKNKITLSHVEFMGYLENSAGGAYLTGYKNIFNQFPSVASAFGPDGLTFFNYYTCIYFNSRKLPAETAEAARGISDGLKAYRLISTEIADQSSHLALYVPYSDWCVERWTNCFLPATDALCRLGVSPEIIPFVPKKGEEILPFYPMNLNRVQLDFLLDNKYVLILPDISGMQETDSELIETFVRNGGTVIAFGPGIPYGDRFDRDSFWGAEETSPIQNKSSFSRIRIKRSPGSRTIPISGIWFDPVVSTSWNPQEEKRIADFPDGSSAVFSNTYEKGKTYVVTQSINDAVNNFPDLVRDILDEALGNYGIKRPYDVYGMNENMDIAMNEKNGKYSLMAANYNDIPVEIKIKPLVREWKKNYDLVDMNSDIILQNVTMGQDYFKVKIDACDFIAISLIRKNEVK